MIVIEGRLGTSKPASIPWPRRKPKPCSIYTYITLQPAATIPLSVWSWLLSYENRGEGGRRSAADGRSDDGHPSYLVSVAAVAAQSAVPLAPSFLLLPSFILPPSSLPYISLSRYAISPCSAMNHRTTPSLSPPAPSSLLSPPHPNAAPSHGGIAQQDMDCKRGRSKSNPFYERARHCEVIGSILALLFVHVNHLREAFRGQRSIGT